MKKKIITIILICSLIITYIPGTIIYGAGEPADMQTAYDEISMQRPDWSILFPVEAFDIDIWNNYKVLLLDNSGTYPSNLASILEPDGSANDYNSDAGEYRYIGKNPDGFLVNNPMYPDDHSGSAVINTYEWQENTDVKTEIAQYMLTTEDEEFYKKEIFYFLETEYEARFDDTVDPQIWLDNAIVIVPVSSTGKGVIKFMHKWDSDHNGVKEDWYITVNLRSKNDAIVEGWVTETTTPTNNTGTAVVALSTTRIAADNRGTESFDVTKGIPTSEDLYANVQASEYVHNETYNHVDGSITYKVTVTKRYRLWRWDLDDVKIDLNLDGDYDDPGETTAGWDSKIETVTKTYDVVRNYSFHMIDELAVYSLDKADITNAALPGGAITLNSTVVAPIVNMTRDTVVANHYIVPISGTTHSVDAGTQNIGKSHSNLSYDPVPNQNLQSNAEAGVGEVQVRNDSLAIDGTTLMDGAWYETATPTPSLIPDAPLNNLDDLYQKDLTIANTITNGVKTSSGTISYYVVENTGSETSYSMALTDLNDVIVHTPVVCYPELNDISRQTQQMNIEEDQLQLVVEETFHIDYPTVGTHLAISGYGTRDYDLYTQVKQVKFPFDVYVGNGYDDLFLPKNTWGNFNSLENTFFVPSWVDEEDGHILFRTIANNIPDINDNEYDYNANLSTIAYKAVEAIEYNISGKINKLTVTDCLDDFWNNKFIEDEATATKHVMSIGTTPDNEKEIVNNNSRINFLTANDVLPLMPGKTYIDEDNETDEVGETNEAGKATKAGETKVYDGVMLGYPIEFFVETNGDLMNDNDIISIKPSFEYVKKVAGNPDMSTRIPVDLYVSEFGKLKQHDVSILLTDKDRSFVGNILDKDDSISRSIKTESVQYWQGKFYLPNMTYAVPTGTNLSEYNKLDLNNEPFLQDGYIIVNFNIRTYNDVSLTEEQKEIYRNNRKDYDAVKLLDNYLSTLDIHMEYGNGWTHEGYNTSQLGFDLKIGDVMFYSTNRRASQTYY